MKNVFEHQRIAREADPLRSGIFTGTGSGKTRTALMLAEGMTLVIAPKTQRDDQNWQREWGKMLTDGVPTRMRSLTVLSKEEFRRDHEKTPRYDTIILDEAHTMLGATPNIRWVKRVPYPKCSQIFEAVRAYVDRTKPKRLYLATATITRSPMTVWAAAVLLGKPWDFYKFRAAFYVRLPMPGREVWSPRKDQPTKDRLGKAVRGLGFTGKLSDFFDVPEQTHRIIKVPLSAKQKQAIASLPMMYPNPLVLVGKTHQVENGVLMQEGEDDTVFESEKNDHLESLLEEFPKVIVFAKYRAQINAIADRLKKDMPVYILTGDTKDRKSLIADANASERCVFIAQSQVSAGYELPTFRCTVFASMSYSFVDLEQARGRALRANALAKNLYVYLLSGDVDHAVWEALEHKKDFSEAVYAEKFKKK